MSEVEQNTSLSDTLATLYPLLIHTLTVESRPEIEKILRQVSKGVAKCRKVSKISVSGKR